MTKKILARQKHKNLHKKIPAKNSGFDQWKIYRLPNRRKAIIFISDVVTCCEKAIQALLFRSCGHPTITCGYIVVFTNK